MKFQNSKMAQTETGKVAREIFNDAIVLHESQSDNELRLLGTLGQNKFFYYSNEAKATCIGDIMTNTRWFDGHWEVQTWLKSSLVEHQDAYWKHVWGIKDALGRGSVVTE